MEKEFVPHEQALALKELGFDEPCFGYYLETGQWVPASYSREGTVFPSNNDLILNWASSPLWRQAFRWFRKKHGLVGTSQITTSDGTRENWWWEINNLQGKNIEDGQELSDEYDSSKEEADLACLNKLIELVKAK